MYNRKACTTSVNTPGRFLGLARDLTILCCWVSVLGGGVDCHTVSSLPVKSIKEHVHTHILI